MKRTKKYNLIIYTCLLLAAVLLILGGRGYLKEQQEGTVIDEIINTPDKKEENKIEEIPTEKEIEPEELQKVDKVGVIKKYLDSIAEHIYKKEKVITYKIIKTWGDYELGEVEYQRKITTNYYEYKVNINIPKQNAKLPCPKNEELSNEEFVVITLYFDIIESERVNGYIVKNVDIIEES